MKGYNAHADAGVREQRMVHDLDDPMETVDPGRENGV